MQIRGLTLTVTELSDQLSDQLGIDAINTKLPLLPLQLTIA